MSKTQINLQDSFLNQVRKESIPVILYLTSGVQRRRTSPANTIQSTTDYNVNLKARWEY